MQGAYERGNNTVTVYCADSCCNNENDIEFTALTSKTETLRHKILETNSKFWPTHISECFAFDKDVQYEKVCAWNAGSDGNCPYKYNFEDAATLCKANEKKCSLVTYAHGKHGKQQNDWAYELRAKGRTL